MCLHIFTITARILLPCLLKSNGRDKSYLTLNEDENKHFIEKADQDYDAIKTTGKYSWLELLTGQINKKLKKIP